MSGRWAVSMASRIAWGDCPVGAFSAIWIRPPRSIVIFVLLSTHHGAGFRQLRLAAERRKHRSEGRAFEITARAALGPQVTARMDHLALTDGMGRHAGHLPPFEDVVVDQRALGLRRNRTPALRIPQHQIGIGSRGNDALARIEIEDP